MTEPTRRARAHLLVTGGAGFIGCELVRQVLGAPRRHADHGPRQADLRRQPRRTSPPSRTTRSRPPGSRSSRATSPTRRSSSRSSPTWTRWSTSPPRPTSTARSWIRRRSSRTGVIGVHVLLEAVPRPRADRARDPLPPGQHRRGVRRQSPRAAPRDRQPRPAQPVRGRQGRRASCWSARYHVTYGLDVVITRGSNTYGPYQHPEKLIPLFITNALDGKPLPMYGDGMQVRDWLYVERPRRRASTSCSTTAQSGEAYNVAGGNGATEPRGHRPAARATGRDWCLVLTVAGPARPRPPLRDGRRQARGARLARASRRSSAACPRPSPGTATTPTGSRAPERRLGRLLRAPVRRAARGGASGRRRRADRARRGHRLDGRLGRALVEALEDAPFTGPMGPIAWSRKDLDLDTLTTKRVRALIDRDRPEIVIHAAAWTDVDGCAREPDLAARRNGTAAGIVAEACAAAGWTSPSCRRTRCSTGRGPTAAATARTRSTRSTRTAPASSAARCLGRGGRRLAARDRADVVAPRSAGQRLPREDRPRGAPGQGGRHAAQGGVRRDRDARRGRPTSPTRSSS